MRGQSRFFYGWVVVAMCFLMAGLGATQMLVGVLVVPFSEAFAAPRGQVLMLTSSLMMLAGVVVSPFSGMLIQRYTARRVALFSLAWTGLGYLALCLATQLWQVAAIYMLAMSAGMSMTNLACNALAANWFTVRRGRALGFTAAGMGTCAFILQPLMTYWIGRFGLRTACLCMGLTLLCVVPVVARFLVERPQLRGLWPDGLAPHESPADHHEAVSVEWSVRMLLRQSRFWILVTLVSLIFGAATALFMNLVPLAIDRGFSPAQAAWFASVASICCIVGTVGFGVAADFLGQRMMVWIPALLVASSCVLLTVHSNAVVLFASILLGTGLGAITTAWGTLVGLAFGSRGLGLAMGLMAPSIAAAVGVTTPLAGWINDVYGSYEPALMVFLGALAVSVVIGGFLPSRSPSPVAAGEVNSN